MVTPCAGPAGENVDTSRHRVLGSATRADILRLVRAAPGGTTAAEVAGRTGLHLSTVRAHLDRLTGAGLLVRARASGGQPGRPAWRYRSAEVDPAPAPAPYRTLAAALLDHLAAGGGDTRERAARVGREWGRRLAGAGAVTDDPVEAVRTVLVGLGFDPRPRPGPPAAPVAEIHLHRCPFLELVGRHPDAMCGLHLGVVRGVLDHVGSPAGPTVLEPFGAPTACVVRVPASPPPTGG